MNDQIRKSAYSFELINNKLRIFPKPVKTSKLHFEYIVKSEFDASATSVTDGVVADYSNTGYDFHTYSKINDVGIQWIRKYTLALGSPWQPKESDKDYIYWPNRLDILTKKLKELDTIQENIS